MMIVGRSRVEKAFSCWYGREERKFCMERDRLVTFLRVTILLSAWPMATIAMAVEECE